ncbi:MAG: bifunctional riboflavin kinase/FAD synthetase [Acutalibacteraceae bacterium]
MSEKSIFGFENGSSVALGTFDGVHIGHKRVLEAAASSAKKTVSVALTFGSSPKGAKMLCSPQKKKQLILETGIAAIFNLDFEFVKDISPEKFFSDILIGRFNAKHLVCGFNYRFGKNASGDTSLLERLCSEHGISLTVCKEISKDGDTVSSTRIRNLLENGKIREAARLLGRDFSVCGTVRKGKSLGRRLGFATANFVPDSKLVLPLSGVYATYVLIGDKSFPAVTNLGSQPTFGGKNTVCETHIIGFDGNLYDRTIEIYFLDRLRDIRNFKTAEALEKQVFSDMECSQSLFGAKSEDDKKHQKSLYKSQAL